jgi:Zn-dependent oligopeptidase
MRLEREYKIDRELIRQYFPCDVVVQGVLDLYQELLDLRFTPTPHPHVPPSLRLSLTFLLNHVCLVFSSI